MIFEQIRKSSHKKIFLVIPARAQILHSLVSLKILRFKSEIAGKILTIVTKDFAGREISSEAGIAALDSLKPKKTPKKIETEAVKNFPQPIGRKKIKILEIVSEAKKRLQRISREEIPFANLNPLSGAKKVWGRVAGAAEVEEISESGQLVVHAPSRKILFMFLMGAVVLLFFISLRYWSKINEDFYAYSIYRFIFV